jgi:hypothetical protein
MNDSAIARVERLPRRWTRNAGPFMRVFIACCFALLFAGCAYAQSESPTGFLHCIGQRTDNKSTEHTITLYSKTAIMDGQKYALYSDDAHYELQADDTLTKAVENRTWLILVAINRVTGSYEISDGPAIVQQVKTETGTCTKMDRKL